ncbi:MAG: alpha/beta fold hydrolase [Acidobacteriota bacterium]
MPMIHAGGIDMYYEIHGPEDAAVLVLSNGVFMTTASWVHQKDVLSQHVRLLLYDCRGMGLSDHPAGPYSMALHAHDLAALMDGLGIERAHIGGISYGAEVSMTFAIDHPERVRTLIVASAVSQSDAVLQGMIASWTAAAEANSPRALYLASYFLNFSDRFISENRAAIEASEARFASLDMDAVRELLLAFSRLNLTSELHRITVPTLVMVGEDDVLKPRKYSEIIAREIQNAELVVVPKAGHALPIEQPGIFNSLVLGFIARFRART